MEVLSKRRKGGQMMAKETSTHGVLQETYKHYGRIKKKRRNKRIKNYTGSKKVA